MEFDINIQLKMEQATKVIKVRYGATIRDVLDDNGISGDPVNQYGVPIPDKMPLRGPANFIISPATQ
jgi:hypothetical protein